MDLGTLQYIITAVIINGLTVGGLYAVVASSLTIKLGCLKVPDVANGQYFILGSYVILTVTQLLPSIGFLPAVIVSVLFAIPLFFLIEKFLIARFYEKHNAIVLYLLITIGYSMIIRNLLEVVYTTNQKTLMTNFLYTKVNLGSFRTNQAAIIGIVASFALNILLLVFLRYTKTGKSMRALIQDREMLKVLGVNVQRLSGLAFVLASIFAFIGGIIYALVYTWDLAVAGTIGVSTFVFVIVGGMGSIAGSIAVGLLLGFTQAIVSLYFRPVWGMYIFYAILFATLMYKPQGLFRR